MTQETRTILFENKDFIIFTSSNPHIPPKEGLHVIVKPRREIESALVDPDLAAETFKIAVMASQEMKKLKLAPWFNLQANGNWGLLPGAKPFFHVHIYARRKGKTWGEPVHLPIAPGTFHNPPMKKTEIEKLANALKKRFTKGNY